MLTDTSGAFRVRVEARNLVVPVTAEHDTFSERLHCVTAHPAPVDISVQFYTARGALVSLVTMAGEFLWIRLQG